MKEILVVGGGLAGLTSARQLARHGFKVTVLEASSRVGGKAGADLVGGRVLEHGYHIFPGWYRNVRPILEELGVKLIDFDRWHSRVIDQGPARWVTAEVPHSLVSLYRSLTQGLLPWPSAVLYWYFVLDMLAEPLSNKAVLDRVSRIGLMRGRWYMTPQIPEMESENVLKASAIPLYEMSAMTAKKISAFWVKQPQPFLSILPGDLQSVFIEPYAKKVVADGVAVRLGQKVVRLLLEGNAVTGVQLEGGGTLRADAVVVTTPLEVSRELMDGPLQRLDPDLGRFEHLQAAPMAALHLFLKEKLQGPRQLPREHCFLHGGRYGLSFIDCSQHWEGQATTYLSFISSNFIPLQQLPLEDAYAALLEEIERYLGIGAADIERWHLLPHVEQPLFINTVGAWEDRPKVKPQGVRGLYFAGDWVRNGIDLACMEGAVSTALNAAHQVAKDFGIDGLPKALHPHKYPAWLLRAAKWGLAPAMLPLALFSRWS